MTEEQRQTRRRARKPVTEPTEAREPVPEASEPPEPEQDRPLWRRLTSGSGYSDGLTARLLGLESALSRVQSAIDALMVRVDLLDTHGSVIDLRERPWRDEVDRLSGEPTDSDLSRAWAALDELRTTGDLDELCLLAAVAEAQADRAGGVLQRHVTIEELADALARLPSSRSAWGMLADRAVTLLEQSW